MADVFDSLDNDLGDIKEAGYSGLVGDTDGADVSSSNLAQAVLVQRVQSLEDKLATYEAALSETRSQLTTAKEAQELAEHQAAQNALDRKALESAFAAQYSAETQRLQAEHAKSEAALLDTQADLQKQLEDEKNRCSCLMKALENEGKAQQATRELASHVGDLERRNALLRKRLETETARADAMTQKAEELEASTKKLIKSEGLAADAQTTAQVLRAELIDTQVRLEEASRKGQAHGRALHQVVALISDCLKNSTHSLSRTGLSLPPLSDAGFGINGEGTEGGGASTVNVDKAIAAAHTFCSAYSTLESAVDIASKGDQRLQNLLSEEIERGRQMAAELAQAKGDAQTAHQALTTAEARLQVVNDNAAELESCRRELSASMAKAAVATVECSALREEVAALTAKLSVVEQRATEAETQLASIQDKAEARDERVIEMRHATASALRQAACLKDEVQKAVVDTARRLQEVGSHLKPLCSGNHGNSTPSRSAAATAGGGSAPIDELSHQLLVSLDTAAELLVTSEDPSTLGTALTNALALMGSGYMYVLDMVAERYSMHSTIAAALTALNSTDQNLKSLGSLADMVHWLTDTATSLEAAVDVERQESSREKRRLKKENRTLQTQIQSLQTATQSVLDYAGGDERQTLQALSRAQRRVSELESMNDELRKRAEKVQRTTQRDWDTVREDMGKLVHHAEQAQKDAESALQRQQAEAAMHAAQAARLKQQVVTLQQELNVKTKAYSNISSTRAVDGVAQTSPNCPDQYLGLGVAHNENLSNNANAAVAAMEEQRLAAELASAQEQLTAALRRCEESEATGKVDWWAKERALSAQAHDLRCEVAEIKAELAATKNEAVGAEARAVYLEMQLRRALEVSKSQSEELENARKAVEEERQRSTKAAATNEELALLHQQLQVAQQRCEVLQARLTSVRGSSLPESDASRQLRRYVSGLNALARALAQLDETVGYEVFEAVNSAPEKVVDALLLHLHRRDMDVGALSAQLRQLEAAMQQKLSELHEGHGILT